MVSTKKKLGNNVKVPCSLCGAHNAGGQMSLAQQRVASPQRSSAGACPWTVMPDL
jgi:hypothetical protein